MSATLKEILRDNKYRCHKYDINALRYENKKLSESFLVAFAENDPIIINNYIESIKILLFKFLINISNGYCCIDNINEAVTCLKKLALSYFALYRVYDSSDHNKNFYYYLSIILLIQSYSRDPWKVIVGSAYTLFDNIINDIFLQLDLTLDQAFVNNSEAPNNAIIKKFYLSCALNRYTNAIILTSEIHYAYRKRLQKDIKFITGGIKEAQLELTSNHGKEADSSQIVNHINNLIKLGKYNEVQDFLKYTMNHIQPDMRDKFIFFCGIILFKLSELTESKVTLESLRKDNFNIIIELICAFPLIGDLIHHQIMSLNKSLKENGFKFLGHLDELSSLIGITLQELSIENPDYLLCANFKDAIFAKHDICCSELLKKHEPIDKIDERGYTALHQVCDVGDTGGVEFLLTHGASYTLLTKPKKQSPLHLAVLNGHTECVSLLMNAGADPNKNNSNKKSPIDYARDLPPKNTHPIMALLQKHPVPSPFNIDAEQKNKKEDKSCVVALDKDNGAPQPLLSSQSRGDVSFRANRAAPESNAIVPVATTNDLTSPVVDIGGSSPRPSAFLGSSLSSTKSINTFNSSSSFFAQPQLTLFNPNISVNYSRKPKEIFYRLNMPSAAQKLVEHFHSLGANIFLVGGAIRDSIAGKRPRDYDFVTDLSIDKSQELFQAFSMCGKHKKSVVVNLDGLNFDVTTLNQTKKNDVISALCESSFTRDYTINSLFWDPYKAIILDFQDGYQDLQSKTLKMIGDPKRRFQEDPLRIMRGIRIAAKLDLSIEPSICTNIPFFVEDLYRIHIDRLSAEYQKFLDELGNSKSLSLMAKFQLTNIITNRLNITVSEIQVPYHTL